MISGRTAAEINKHVWNGNYDRKMYWGEREKERMRVLFYFGKNLKGSCKNVWLAGQKKITMCVA